ncbi:MAG: hypothetical protein GPJ54_12225 [Candidatus Heimdallarchaeota archaeon]|nr:hypothetical protein [Candidatus Heimdallarchaeota archaeon]
MSSYKTLSILQSLVIFLCGLSVFDFGYGVANLDDGIGFNKFLFDNSDSDFWNGIVFWGYCIIVVGILQLVKSLSSD